MTSVVARQQADSREEQRRLNSELRATRTLLTESSRIGERMRISRELHDLVGHHLTALSLNLEVASHLANGAALDHMQAGAECGQTAADRRARSRQPAARRRQHRSHRSVEDTDRRRARAFTSISNCRRVFPSTIRAARRCCCAAHRRSSPIRCAMPARAIFGCASSARRTNELAIHARDDGRGATASQARQRADRHARAPRADRRPAQHHDRARPRFRARCMAAAGGDTMTSDFGLPGRRSDPGAAGHPLAARAVRRHPHRRRSGRRHAGDAK